MKLNSAYFNMVRAQPRRQPQMPEAHAARCQMPGCMAAGNYRAPKHHARSAEKNWQYFCLDHIGDFNKSYNFFASMSEAEILEFQKSALIGHRPTWRLGTRGPRRIHDIPISSYFDFLRKKRTQAPPHRQRISARKARALEVLGLDRQASLHQIRSRFKELVKRYHPDLNDGGRKYEHRLKAIIQSYHELKKTFRKT